MATENYRTPQSDRSFWMPELYVSPGKDRELGAEHISLEKHHRTGWCSFASAHGGKWEGAVEGKKVLGRKWCHKLPLSQEIKTSVEIERDVCNTSSSTSHLTVLISRCTEYCTAIFLPPPYSWCHCITYYVNSSLYLSCPKKKGTDGGMFLLIYCLLFHTPPPHPEEDLSIEAV